MRAGTISEHSWFRPALGAVLTVLCGLILWCTRLGVPWENASYDFLFLADPRPITNTHRLVIISVPHTNVDRGLYVKLLNKLIDGGCPLVIFDIFFLPDLNKPEDAELAKAMRRHGRVVLMAGGRAKELPVAFGVQAELPHQLLLDAATNWGIGQAREPSRGIQRRHWPIPGSGEEEIQSLPWVAAKIADTNLVEGTQERWLRYYGERGGWESYSAADALAASKPAEDFQGKTVFIGGSPQTRDPSEPELDKFSTPYTWRTTKAVGGVEIMATTFLNLVNGDWLRRFSNWTEFCLLVLIGILLGGGLCQVVRVAAFGLAAGAFLCVMAAAVWLSHSTNYWFPWLFIAGGQVPCALAWALRAPSAKARPDANKTTVLVAPVARPPAELLVTHEYRRFEPPIGEGAFGKVWLAETVTKERKALKVVYQAECEKNQVPYEAEFQGITKYKPVSNDHPGLLHIDHVGRNDTARYFYYVMELGDPMSADWDGQAGSYRSRDLENVLEQAFEKRLPIRECVEIGLALAEALDFLHQRGLVHRDIKPRNILFVKGRPKLADIGLVTGIRTTSQIKTFAGTLPYMPPLTEPPGTPQSDLYSLGKLIYVASTGLHPLDDFPKLPEAVIKTSVRTDFMLLDAVFIKACQPDLAQRYASAAEMHAALLAVHKALGG